MSGLLNRIPRWLPALIIMVVIFLFSSRSSNELPYYEDWEYFVKKNSHIIVYGLLALSYLHAMPKKNYFLAWLLAILYAATDEFHQSFVPGRHPSVIDVLVFDNLGAVIVLWIHNRFYR
jgi:VanZ family protein